MTEVNQKQQAMSEARPKWIEVRRDAASLPLGSSNKYPINLSLGGRSFLLSEDDAKALIYDLRQALYYAKDSEPVHD